MSEQVTDPELAGYIERLEQRTGQKWHVVKRYDTTWPRATLENKEGERRRMYHNGDRWRKA